MAASSGFEAKASASAGPNDFRGLRLLRERLGERFRFGALLYTGGATVPFGDRLAAVPLQGLGVALERRIAGIGRAYLIVKEEMPQNPAIR